MLERFDQDARVRVISLAAEEAKRRGDGRIGTEHLLLALLHGSGGRSAGTLGIDLASARSALDDLDRAALAAIGVDLAQGPSSVAVLNRRRPPFTSGARAVLKRAALAARAVKANRIQARHLLLGVLTCEPADPAAQLLVALGVDRTEARNRILQSNS